MSMRNQDVAYPTGTAAEVSQPQNDLKSLLSQITDQILDQDRRHVELLQDVQKRLGHLGKEAHNVRMQVAPQHAPVLDRIESGMNKLGTKIADARLERKPAPAPVEIASVAAVVLPAQPAALKSVQPPRAVQEAAGRQAVAPISDSIEIVEAHPRSRASEPWDSDTAEALTRVYEALASSMPSKGLREEVRSAARPRSVQPVSGPASTPPIVVAPVATAAAIGAPAAVPSHTPFSVPTSSVVGCADRAWLEERLSRIAGSVEQILEENRASGVIKAFGDRFEEFEERMGQALESVATRADVESLRHMEAHITELTQYFDAAQSRLDRLDGIESDLKTVVNQLSDARLSQILPAAQGSAVPAEIEHLVTSAAKMAAIQVQRLQPHGQDLAVSELKFAVDTFMAERRQGDEQTAMTLEMMQQALERILERLDTLDLMQAQPSGQAHGVPNFEQTPHDPGMSAQEARGPAPSRSVGFESGSNFDEPDHYAPNQNAEEAPHWQRGGHTGEIETHPDSAETFFEDDADVGPAPAAAAPQMQPQPPATRPDGRPLSAIEKIRQDFIADAQRAKQKAAAEAAAKAAEEAAKTAAGKKGARTKSSLEVAPASSAFGSKSRIILVGALAAIVAVMGVLLLMPRGKPKRSVVPNAAIEQPLLPSDTVGMPNAEKPEGNAAPDAAGEDLGFEDAPAAPQQNMMLDPAAGEDPNVQSMSLQSPGQAPLSLDLIKLDVPDAEENTVPSQAAPVAASLRLESQSTANEPVTQNRKTKAPLDLPPATVGPLSLRLAAAEGDPSAEFEVGTRLAEGKGTQQDFKEAIRWYQRSASRGFAQSQYRLATLFERGLGTKPDLARARVWYQRAAEQGNVKAMHNLAVLSAGRESGSPDYMTAAKWFEAAAQHGLADSQFNLAVLTEAGLGVAKDQKSAYKWFSLAARSGDAESIRRRDALKAQMSPDDLAEAELLAGTFAPKPLLPLVNDSRVAGEDWKKRQSPEKSG
jgi:localization factor PodJL